MCCYWYLTAMKLYVSVWRGTVHWLENHRSTECLELEELCVCAKGDIKTVLGLNTRFLISNYVQEGLLHEAQGVSLSIMVSFSKAS